MEEVYHLHQGKPDQPHRHDYYVIVLIDKAKGSHIIDFHAFELASHQVFFISPGQVHQMIEEEVSEGYIITFSPEFMFHNGIERCFIDDLYLFNHYGHSPPLVVDDDMFRQLASLADQLSEFAHSQKKFRYQAIGALLKLFLIQCNNACSLADDKHPQLVEKAATLLRSFKLLIEEKFRQWHKVSQYAQALHLTPDYLNASVKSLTGITAKTYIQNRLIIESKRLILFSSLSQKEIAYQLGFSEPANFSQFFKKYVGVSPSQFASTSG